MAQYIALRHIRGGGRVRVPSVLAIGAPAGLAPTTHTATSTLATATYYYKVTALGTSGETTGSSEVSAAVTGAVSEVQSLVVNATAGQYKLTFGAQTTPDLAFNAAASGAGSVQAALVALSSIGAGNVAVTGGPGNSGGTTPYTITFQGALANASKALITTSAGTTPLSGGASTATVTEATAGSPGTTVALSWTATPNAVGYRVYRGTAPGAEGHYFTSSNNSYTDVGGTGTVGTVPTSDTAEASVTWTQLSSTADTIVDLDSAAVRRALAHHQAIGQWFVTGLNSNAHSGIAGALTALPANS